MTTEEIHSTITITKEDEEFFALCPILCSRCDDFRKRNAVRTRCDVCWIFDERDRIRAMKDKLHKAEEYQFIADALCEKEDAV